MVEQDVRYRIDRELENKGWIIDPNNPSRNVFFEGAVRNKIPDISRASLGQRTPDYTLFDGDVPIAIIEAKKPTVSRLDDALTQASNYAESINCGIGRRIDCVFACNGNVTKSLYLENREPLFCDDIELYDFPPLNILQEYQRKNTNRISTLPEEVIKSRDQLIDIFRTLNDRLRATGLTAGIERFSEFANIFFLKLLAEQGNDSIWSQLQLQDREDIIPYLNQVAVPRLAEQYGGEVICHTTVQDPIILQNIISQISPLRFSRVGEDVKGTAFEHFMSRTTAQNDLGEYYTPRHIVKFIVKLLDPQFGGKIYDPFCGTGGFLTESFKYLSRQVDNTYINAERLQRETIYGGEITSRSRIAKMNMILFGDGHSGVNRQNSLTTQHDISFDYVLTNIPFSQRIEQPIIDSFCGRARDGDEACVVKCIDSLAVGGSMAIVVPEGLLYNRNHKGFLADLFGSGNVRLVVRLPRGCFAPYTEAGTAIIFMTDKGVKKTEKFYSIIVRNDGFDNRRNPVYGTNDLDKILFHIPNGVRNLEAIPDEADIDSNLVKIENLENKERFTMKPEWKISNNCNVVTLSEIANLTNGTPITERKTEPGNIPVIAGGKATIPYFHNQSNREGNIITISKSGAFSGYVWWHDDPIWSSDSFTVKSKDESKFLTRFLYMCLKVKQDEIYDRQQGTGQPHIYIYHLDDFPIPDISLDQQKAILKDFEKKWNELNIAKRAVSDAKNSVDESIKRMYKIEE